MPRVPRQGINPKTRCSWVIFSASHETFISSCIHIFAMRFLSPTARAKFGQVGTSLAESSPTRRTRRSVKVLVSLGGWGWDKQFASIVSKPEAEDRYAKSVMAIVDENDYDGIDLDWEYPDTEQEVIGFETG